MSSLEAEAISISTGHEGSTKILRVRVVSGTIPRQNLSFSSHILSDETYYVRISLKRDRNNAEIHTEYKTTIKKTKNPKWDEEFLFRMDSTKQYVLRFEVFISNTVNDKGERCIGYLKIPLNHTTISTERPGRDVACKEFALTPNLFHLWHVQRPEMYERGHLLLYLAYVDNEEEIKTSNENHSAPQEVREVTDKIHEDLVPNVQDVLETNAVDEELTLDWCKKDDEEEEEVIDDDETYKVVLDKSILVIKECMDPEPILDRFQAYADIPYPDVRDIRQQTTTTQKNDKIIGKIRQKHNCYKQFKKYLVESSQLLLQEYIEKTENGVDTTDVLIHLKEETRRRELKERREQKLKEEITRNVFEEQLVISISKGQDFDGTEEIDERLTIYTSADPNSRSYCNVVKCILEGATETHSEQIVKAVKDVASIINMKIKTSIDEDNTVIMTMACISCEELRELLKILGGDEFKSKICNLENVLSEEYNTNCKIQDKVSHEKIQEVQKHLIDQGVVNEEYSDKVFCGTHHQHEVELFCPQHDQFFCYECEEKHRMCKGLRQITKDENTKEYRIRSDEPKEELCTTLKLCLLPTCEVLLVDNVNKRLKKLDLTYHVVGQYQFEDNDTPLDVCAVSGSKAVVTLGHTVYVVNVENTIKVDSYFRTEKPCFRFDRKGNIIYYTDNERIYKCDENGKRLDELHRFKAQTFCNCLIVSNDSGKIIVGARKKCLMIINTNKSEQSTLILEGLTDCTDLCMLSNRIVLVCEKNSLCLVDIEQGQRVKTVAVKSMGFLKYRSIVFDETNNTVIAGNLAKDFITVFEVDTEYEAP